MSSDHSPSLSVCLCGSVFMYNLQNCKCCCSVAIPANKLTKGQQKQLENLTAVEIETTTTGNLDGTTDRILKCNYDTSNSSVKDLD